MSVYPLPLVSIQIVTFNQENYIGEAIESAIKQCYPNCEVIVVDDCSTDNTSLVVDKYVRQGKVKYFRNKSNVGLVRNCQNALYNYCNGEWVVNLDGDDYFTDTQFISNAINKIISLGGTERVMFYQATVKSKNEKSGQEYTFSHKIISKDWELISGEEYFMRCYENEFFSHIATIYNRRKAIEVGFYENNIANSDLESMLKLSLQGSVILENKVIGVWRIHGNNATAKSINGKSQALETNRRISQYSKRYIGETNSENWNKMANKRFIYLFREELARRGCTMRLLTSIFNDGAVTKRTFVQIPKSILSWVKNKIAR